VGPATGVLCAVRGAAEVLVVRALDDDAGLQVTRRCADLAELQAAAEAGLGRVAVVSGDLDLLDLTAVATLRATGVALVVLLDPERSSAADRSRVAAADLLLDAPSDEAGARAVAQRVAGLATAVPADARGVLPPDPWAPSPVPVQERGRVVAVWGPTGAPGRSTVALQLAAEVAARGVPALLVDADTYGGCQAQLLGLLDEAPGLAAAARAAGQGALDVVALARFAPFVAPDLRLLSGIARADRWPELPGPALDAVWLVARSLAAVTVVDCGFCVEQDEVLSYDTRAPRRNAATLGALAGADEVVVVGAADPVGVHRLVRALTDLAELGVTAPRRVVVNRVRPSVAGPQPGRAVARALERYAGVTDAVLLPDDAASLDAAVLEARTLREIAPGSPVRRALEPLVARVAEAGRRVGPGAPSADAGPEASAERTSAPARARA
jgi:Flp pilus assembly CpaE family ATPase